MEKQQCRKIQVFPPAQPKSQLKALEHGDSGEETAIRSRYLPSPPNQFSPVEAFLATRSPILSRSRIQQVRKTLGSLQKQNQKKNNLLAKHQMRRGHSDGVQDSWVGWWPPALGRPGLQPSSRTRCACSHLMIPAQCCGHEEKVLVFFASYGQETRGAVTFQAPGSNCAGGSLLSPGAGECLAAKNG